MADAAAPGSLAGFLFNHPGDEDEAIAYWVDGSITLAEMKAAAKRVAAALRASGVSPGQPVATIIDSGPEALAAMFGTWLVGAISVPVNARLTDQEIRTQLDAASVAVVMGHAGRDVGLGDQWVATTGDLQWVPARRPVAAGRRQSGDVALIMRTSGTTGEAKLITLNHRGVADGIDTVLASLRANGPSSNRPARRPMPNLIPSNLALWAGSWNALFALRAGAPMVLMDRFSSRDFATLVSRHQIRSSVLAPAMMSMLVEDEAVTDLAPLSMVRSVTAPLTPQQARAFRAKFGIGVMNCYGQTELGSEVVGWTSADLRAYGESKLGAVGRAHEGVELRVLDEDHNLLPANTVGELWVRSPFASDAPDIAARLVDGFLRTGDVGRVDREGFLWIEGRVSDMINRGGLKVLPQEVEDVLRTLPGVLDACVAGVYDDRLGQVPVAWIRASPGSPPDPSGVIKGARALLSGFKVPVEVIVVEDFPRNEIGKVLRTELIGTLNKCAPGESGD